MRVYQLMGGPMMKFFTFVALAGLIVCFQNCSDKQFSAKTDLNKSMSLDGTEQLVTDDTPVVTEEDDETLEFEDKDKDVVTEIDDDKDDDKDVVTEIDDDKDDDKDGVTEIDDDKDDDKDGDKGKKICMRHGVKLNTTDIGVCILEGSGKSQRVALINNQIVSNNSTPKTVCMSALACRKIVDSKFDVVSLEKRGFCKNGSAHSILLTDAQVRTLIDQTH